MASVKLCYFVLISPPDHHPKKKNQRQWPHQGYDSQIPQPPLLYVSRGSMQGYDSLQQEEKVRDWTD